MTSSPEGQNEREPNDGQNWLRYDTRQLLECSEYPSLRRKVGVIASAPYHHHGLNAEYVEVLRETVTINTKTWGTSSPEEAVVSEIEKATRRTLADLDRVIDELTSHRERLIRALDTVVHDYEAGYTNASVGGPSVTPPVIDVELSLFEHPGGVS